MTRTPLQEEWLTREAELHGLQTPAKLGQLGTLELWDRYRALSEPQRREIDSVLFDQLESPAQSARSLAASILFEFKVRDGLKPLQRLAERLEAIDSPSAHFEHLKMLRYIEAIQSNKPAEPA